MSSSPEVEFEEVEAAIDRAKEHFNICPNRTWGFANSLPEKDACLPSLVPQDAASCGYKPHRGASQLENHDQCSLDFCELSVRDFTSVPQRHERSICTGAENCSRLSGAGWFPRDVLAAAATAGTPTAWMLGGGGAMVEPLQFYMAVSHVWSDGTGNGAWPPGEVNSCLYAFFERIARSFECEGLWWDTLCIPREKAARTKAIAKIQACYEDARVTLVHDCFLRDWEWVDPRTAAFAIVMSPWFSRGWTALELAKSRKVKVLFKRAGGKGYVVKDIDEDILACGDAGPAGAAIAKLRRNTGVSSVNDILCVLGPRNTSWPRDVAVISGLLAGVHIGGGAQQQEIYQRILTKIGNISHEHLFHNRAPMQGNYAWCATSLIGLPMAVEVGSPPLRIEPGGAIVGRWKAMPADSIPLNNYVWRYSYPLMERKLRSVLAKEERSKHVLLIEPWVKLASRALLVRVMRSRSAEVACRFLGPVYFHTPHELGASGKQRVEATVRIDRTSASEEVEGDAWAEVNRVAKRESGQEFEAKIEIQRQNSIALAASGLEDEECISALLQASAEGDEEMVARLLVAGTNPSCQNEQGQTPLHLAAWRRHFSVVQRFVKVVDHEGRKIPDRHGQLALHLAAERGEARIFALLLDGNDGSSLKFRCNNQETALHRAAWGGSNALVSLILNAATCDSDLLDAQSKDGKTALHVGAKKGNASVTRQLLQAGASPTIRDCRGRIPLHWAAYAGDMEVVELLARVCDVDAQDLAKKTPLAITVEEGHVDVAKFLVDSGAAGLTLPMLFGMERCDEGVLTLLLLERIVDPKVVDSEGRTLLSLAGERGYEKLVKRLLDEFGADPNAKSTGGSSLLYFAVETNRNTICELLLATGKVDINAADTRTGRTPFLEAVRQGSISTAEKLLNTGAVEINTIGIHDGMAALDWAEELRDGDMLNLLSRRGARVNAKLTVPLEGLMSFEEAVEKGRTVDVLRICQVRKPDDFSLRLAVRSSAVRGHLDIFQLLFAPERLRLDEENAATALGHAAGEGRMDLVQWLLHRIKNLKFRQEALQKVPLRNAAKNGHAEIIQVLINTGYIDINFKDRFESTLLSFAAEEGRVELVQLLLKARNLDFNQHSNNKALSYAAVNGHAEVVRLIIDSGKIDLNQRDNLGNTPLIYAAESGHAEIIKLLLDTGTIKVNLQNRELETALFTAAERGHAEVVRLLLGDAEVDINLRNERSETPFSRAVQCGKTDVVRLLLKTGKIDVNVRDKNGYSSLPKAAGQGYVEIVRLCLEVENPGIERSILNDTFTRAARGGARDSKDVVELILKMRKPVVDLDQYDNEEEFSRHMLPGPRAKILPLLREANMFRSCLRAKDQAA